ncbi:MAG TPA: transcriptional regulator [Longimicrobiaceae bacterium]|nr:transcriptional regulator [Longimicrobiaceae bacterium]
MAEPKRAPRPAAPALRSLSGGAEDGAPELDRLIHERVRLGIVSALAVNASLTFNELKDMLGLTDGNLSVHARRLEEAGYVECHKGFEGRVPRTEFRLADVGRRALEAYLNHMEALIQAVRDR